MLLVSDDDDVDNNANHLSFLSSIDPVQVAELMVLAIQYLPKELYFPTNDSYIQTLYGQTGLPSTRDLILIGRDATNIRKELFNIPTVAVCYRAIYAVRVSDYCHCYHLHN